MFRYVRLRTPLPCAAIRIARVVKRDQHSKRDVRFKMDHARADRRTDSTRQRKAWNCPPRRGRCCRPMIASAPCIYAMPEVFCHLASQMAARPISRRPEIVRRNIRNDSEPRAYTTHTQQPLG
jgi:hypothetical protein